LKRVPAEDTAGSVREMMERGDKQFGAIAGHRAAGHYGAVILQENIQDNAENFTRFVLLLPPEEAKRYRGPDAKKISLAMRLAHKPGALLASLEPFAKHGVNLLKIESRPIHGRPWEYQFYSGRGGRGAGAPGACAERGSGGDKRVAGAGEIRGRAPVSGK